MLSLRRFYRRHNEIIQEFEKTNWIRQVVNHDNRESLSSIQSDLSAMLDSSIEIHAVGLQSWKKSVRCDSVAANYSRIPLFESSPHQLRQVVQQALIIRVNPHHMLAGGYPRPVPG
jgi:hypothetical protein